jgi:TPR repeat protein
MANREELGVIRGARAGDPASQLALGKLYLFGGASLPRNMPTALHWLHRAAGQQQAEAWMLIGSHVPFEHAQHCLDQVLPWYERAYAAGVEQAGLVLAQVAPSGTVASSLPVPAPAIAIAAATANANANANATAAPASSPAGTSPAVFSSHDSLELAAQAGDRAARLALGLWLARMERDGKRRADGIATVNFKRAIRWLTLAGGQGEPAAWFALSRIYMKPEFSHRCVAEAQVYLERAAELGHCDAQLEAGMYAWRNRRHEADSDVRALYWLQKAANQDCAQAQQLLDRITAAPHEAAWVEGLTPAALRELAARQPLLAARLTLAATFGLSRAEALLIDVKAADHGHCLVVDIRARYGRSKRRLIALRTARERQVLDQILCQFDQVDAGAEGNYRQRLYRLKTCVPAAVEDLLAA